MRMKINKIMFDMEELAFIAAADTKQRSEAIKLISNGIPYAEDKLSAEVARSCVTKLLAITDEEFAELDLSEVKQFD